jgi:hypothetical protein
MNDKFIALYVFNLTLLSPDRGIQTEGGSEQDGRKIFELKDAKEQEDGEYCIMRSFMICYHQHI